jgi:hypothetical protein
MESGEAILQSPDKRRFQVSCKADPIGAFTAGSNSVVVTVGQRIRREDHEEIWDSVSVYAQEDPDGTLVVRVKVFNPDWDEPLQIACIRSRPGKDSMNLTALGCNLDHVTV